MTEEKDWVILLKTLFLEIWLYILIIAVGILLLLGLLLGIWYSLFSDRSYRYKKKIKPISEIESASVFVGSRVTPDVEQLPPFPKSRDQDLPPPVPSLLLSVRRSRQDKFRYTDDGYSSNSDEDREARRARTLERRRYDAEVEVRTLERNRRTDLGYGIIESPALPRQQRQTSTLERFAHRDHGEAASASSLPNQFPHEEVFQSTSEQTQLEPFRSPSSPIVHNVKAGESSESYHGNHHRDIGNHGQRLSSNIDNSIETRLPRTSIKRNHPGSPEKMINVRTVAQYSGKMEGMIYLNQGCDNKAEEKANINSSEDGQVVDSFYHNNPGEEHNTFIPRGAAQESFYHNNPGEGEMVYDENGEDYYTDGFSPALHIVYQNHDVTQETYNQYDEQAYSNSGIQAYHNNNLDNHGNYSNSGNLDNHGNYSNSDSNNHSNDGHYTPHSNDGHYTPHEQSVRGQRNSIYENNEVMDSSEEEFIEFEDISVYMNQPEL